MNTFGKRVRDSRKERGLSQVELAAKSGLSQTTISDIERDRNSGSGELVALARALGVSPEYLAEGRESKSQPSQITVVSDKQTTASKIYALVSELSEKDQIDLLQYLTMTKIIKQQSDAFSASLKPEENLKTG